MVCINYRIAIDIFSIFYFTYIRKVSGKKMRLRWKLVFLTLLVAGGGVLWKNDDARAQFFRELETIRDFLNQLTTGYEPWQVCTA